MMLSRICLFLCLSLLAGIQATSSQEDASSSSTTMTRLRRRAKKVLNNNIFDRNNANVVLCRVTMFDTLFLNKETNTTSTTEQPTCLPIVDGVELDLDFPLDLPYDILDEHESEIQLGRLLVSIADAQIINDKLVLGKKPKYTVFNDDRLRHLQERHMQTTGTFTVAMIRISTSDASPTTSAATLKSTLFGNGVNFMSQYSSCSFGKMKWQLAPNGFYDIQLPNRVSEFASSTDLVTAAQKQLKAQLGMEVSKLATKVMMCLPPGTGSWAASAGVNHWRAQFNNDWCTSLSGVVHELGHTLGLQHANAGGVAYADRTGYMGSGYTNGGWPRKCFNGYNSWKFGWYSSRQLSHNPITSGDKLIKLATIVDFSKTATDEYVVVNLGDQYYIMYNRAKGFNIETEQKKNQVTITEAQTAGTQSLAGLNAGNQYKITNFKGSGQTVVVAACKTMSGAGGAEIMQISVAVGKSLC